MHLRPLILSCVLATVPFAASGAPLTLADLVRAEAAALERYTTLQALVEPIALCTALNDILAGPAQDPIAREYLLLQGTLIIGSRKPAACHAPLLQTLARRAPTLTVWHQDGPHRTAIPAFDSGAAARNVIARRARELAAAQVAAALTREGLAALSTRHKASGFSVAHTSTAAADYARAASKTELLTHRDALLQAAKTDVGFAAAALEAGLRLGDASLVKTGLARAEAAIALKAAAKLSTQFDSSTALSLIDTLASRDALRSAAMFEYGVLLPKSPPARDRLFAALGDRNGGGAAAAALARHADGEILRELGELIAAPPDDVSLKRALLALRLADNTAAEAELRRFVANADDDALSREVATWLAR